MGPAVLGVANMGQAGERETGLRGGRRRAAARVRVRGGRALQERDTPSAFSSISACCSAPQAQERAGRPGRWMAPTRPDVSTAMCGKEKKT